LEINVPLFHLFADVYGNRPARESQRLQLLRRRGASTLSIARLGASNDCLPIDVGLDRNQPPIEVPTLACTRWNF